jgi:hypothetical protein
MNSRTYGLLAGLVFLLVAALGGRVWADSAVTAVDAPAALRNSGVAHTYSGATTVDVSAATYTGYITLLTVESDQAMEDLQVTFDLDMGDSIQGFAGGYTSETITFICAYKVQGLWRLDEQSDTTAISGTNSNNVCVTLRPGIVGPVEDLRIYVKLSAEQTDIILPYVLRYKGQAPATVTNVSN